MPENINLLDKKLWLYKRAKSPVWQMRYAINKGEWNRTSTGEEELEKAKQAAFKIFYSAEERQEQGRAAVSRSFRVVAKAAIYRMAKELENGEGKVTYNDYIRVINNLLTPYFKSKSISEITVSDLMEWTRWRDERIAVGKLERSKQAAINRAKTTSEIKAAKAIKPTIKQASKSTVDTHNSALNRVFDEAEINGWVTKSTRPKLPNKGAKGESRGAFTQEEYNSILRLLDKWKDIGHRKETRELRELLSIYVGFLAGTGIRHGTETYNLKWKHIKKVQVDDGPPYIAVNVDGKRGKRELIATDETGIFLLLLHELNPRVNKLDYEEMLNKGLNEYVFVNRSGDRVTTDALRGAFRNFLNKHNLYIGADDRNRSLYSLRHTYATKALIAGRDIHKLAVQMGTSVEMLERFYSKISARHNASEHAGRTGHNLS